LRLKRPDHTVAAVLALAVLLGGMPLTLGVVVQDHGPMFTLNICHPLQSFDRSPVPVLAVMPEHPAVREHLPERGHAAAPAQPLRLRAADAPDPPPPKALT
jgi:hypothetical protein